MEQLSISFSGDLPNPGIELMSLTSPALAGGSFAPTSPGKPFILRTTEMGDADSLKTWDSKREADGDINMKPGDCCKIAICLSIT